MRISTRPFPSTHMGIEGAEVEEGAVGWWRSLDVRLKRVPPVRRDTLFALSLRHQRNIT
jgi:hypothetical protein